MRCLRETLLARVHLDILKMFIPLATKRNCRLAIRAARFGPEADFVSRAVGEKPTTKEFHRREKNEGPLRGQ